jgi:hypothetical protein
MHQEENARNVFATTPTLLISLATLVLAFVAVGWTGGMPSAEAQGSAPVTVVNTPLPVSLSGTGTITGNVSASQAGAWSVGVTSLPAIQLSPGAQVKNSDVDNPARNALAVTICAGTSDRCPNPFATVGTVGTRYVIEQISGSCGVRNLGIDGWRLKARLNGQDYAYAIQDRLSTDDNTTASGLFFHQTRIYVDGGIENNLSTDYLDRGFSAGDPPRYVDCEATLSGYLVSISPTFPG